MQESKEMPKQKTRSGAKKKFRVTGTGKLMSRGQMSGKLMNKSPKQKRQFSKDEPVDGANTKTVNRMLGRR
jgi:large subunit ribosomal protein L35